MRVTRVTILGRDRKYIGTYLSEKGAFLIGNYNQGSALSAAEFRNFLMIRADFPGFFDGGVRIDLNKM
jgi:hypothetical protein